MRLFVKPTRTAQPYRRGSPHRRPGGALTRMLAGKPALGPNPMQARRELAKSARKRRRGRAVRTGA